MASCNALPGLTQLLPKPAGIEANTSLPPRKPLSGLLCSSFNAKVPSSPDGTAATAASTTISLAAVITFYMSSYRWVLKAACSSCIQLSSQPKGCWLEIGPLWDPACQHFCVAGDAGLSFGWFGLTVGLIALKLYTDTYGYHRMNPECCSTTQRFRLKEISWQLLDGSQWDMPRHSWPACLRTDSFSMRAR